MKKNFQCYIGKKIEKVLYLIIAPATQFSIHYHYHQSCFLLFYIYIYNRVRSKKIYAHITTHIPLSVPIDFSRAKKMGWDWLYLLNKSYAASIKLEWILWEKTTTSHCCHLLNKCAWINCLFYFNFSIWSKQIPSRKHLKSLIKSISFFVN